MTFQRNLLLMVGTASGAAISEFTEETTFQSCVVFLVVE
jgi:hypothetical protein